MSIKKARKDVKRKKRCSSTSNLRPAKNPFLAVNLDVPDELGPWYGYENSISAQMHSAQHPTVITLIDEINPENYSYFFNKFPGRFALGDWFVSAGSCENLAIAGPMESMQKAFEYSTNTYGTEYFVFGGL